MTQKRATLADVAARAGVSATTASYVLNGREAEMRISVSASGRVRQAAAELEYRPNPVARALRATRSSTRPRTLGLVTDTIAEGDFAGALIEGVRVAAREAGHVLVMSETGGKQEQADLVVEEMLERHVHGLVFATLVAREVSVPAALSGLPAVLLNCIDPLSALPTVLPDELAAGKTAARLVRSALRASGVDSPTVWLVGDDADNAAMAGMLRHEGLRLGLARHGVEISAVISTTWTVPAAHAALVARLDVGPRPDVLVCLNDRIAMGAYQALEDHRLSVPGDVSVVSFDGSVLSTWLRPSLTSIRIPYREMGEIAAHLLLRPEESHSRMGCIIRVPMPVRQGASMMTTSGPPKPERDRPDAVGAAT